MHSCYEVVRWIASSDYEEAGVFPKLGIRLHLLMCKHCSRYFRQLRALAEAARKFSQEISSSEIDSMKERLADRLARQS